MTPAHGGDILIPHQSTGRTVRLERNSIIFRSRRDGPSEDRTTLATEADEAVLMYNVFLRLENGRPRQQGEARVLGLGPR